MPKPLPRRLAARSSQSSTVAPLSVFLLCLVTALLCPFLRRRTAFFLFVSVTFFYFLSTSLSIFRSARKRVCCKAHWGEVVSPKGEESRIERIFSKLLKTHFTLLLPAPGLGSALG